MYTLAKNCRICGNDDLRMLLHLGEQCLTGRFPKSPSDELTRGPLELVRCHGADACGLVQLHHMYDPGEMYGEGYGYRSGLNRAMVEHLRGIVGMLRQIAEPRADDIVLDIGSNDGTTLGFYPEGSATLVGIDPSAGQFKKYYRNDIRLIVDFFSSERFVRRFGGRKARIVTSIAMFYDLADPLAFMRDVAGILADDGVWHFEQSYLPTMMKVNAYDTVCHEHLEYYALRQIEWMTKICGLRICDVVLTDANGGSFGVTVTKEKSPVPTNEARVAAMFEREKAEKLQTMEPYEVFARRVKDHREKLMALLRDLKKQGKKVLGYGASTKGNVVLQYCGITPDDLPAIAEVNQEKFGHFTPGTNIPIISEAEAKARKPDYFVVFPWHFRENLLKREAEWIKAGGKMILPFPEIEIYPS
jgi:C-methyltransferase-like protein/putative zinc binding protein/methyltransferase family protein